MPDPSVFQIVGGGFAGSALTYGLSWFRERRRSLDSYRAPQREAIGAIVAASHEYLLCEFQVRYAMNEVVNQARAGGPITSGDDLWAATKARGAAQMALESAFQTAALTIDDAVCFEAQVVAYAAFERLKRAAQEQGETPIENLDEVGKYLAITERHSDALKEAVRLLVDAAYGRVSPVGTWRNGRKRREAQKRLNARRDELLGLKTPADPTPPDEQNQQQS